MTDIVTKEQALSALDDLDDFARMDAGVNATGATDLLKRFIEQSTERNAAMDKIVDHVHNSGKFEIDAAHARITAAMEKRANE